MHVKEKFSRVVSHSLYWKTKDTSYRGLLNKYIYYIDTDKMPGFFVLLKSLSSSRAVKILFSSFTCEDIGVAMVTNMISQLQESFPLRRLAGSFEISFTKWFRGAKTIQLPVTLSMSCHIFTSILFPSLKNIQEDLPKTDLLFKK